MWAGYRGTLWKVLSDDERSVTFSVQDSRFFPCSVLPFHCYCTAVCDWELDLVHVHTL